MPIDKTTANGYMLDATSRVWAKWGNVIPGCYRVPPAGIFVMPTTEASIRVLFTNAWDSVFKKAVQSTQSAQDFPAPAGFVTPERMPSAREIPAERPQAKALCHYPKKILLTCGANRPAALPLSIEAMKTTKRSSVPTTY
jgi:hypothetical protein